MEIEQIKEIKERVGIQIALSLNAIGTEELKILCYISDQLDKLIKLLENPEKQHLKEKKLERLIYGK